MIKNTQLKNMMSFCTYTCYPFAEPIITSLSHNRFAITHPPPNLATRCGTKIEKLDQTHNNEPGTLELRLKCECELLSENYVLIESDFPCPRDESMQNAATHTLPALWSTLDIFKFDTLSDPFSAFQLTSINGSYNPDWKNFIPTLNAAPQKPINALKQDEYITFTEHSLSWWILCPAIFIIVALLSLCCITCFKKQITKVCCKSTEETYEAHNVAKTNGLATFHTETEQV
jgi:hypothetical protein